MPIDHNIAETRRSFQCMPRASIRCLLAIFQLSQFSDQLTSREIANRMQVKPPSICRILDRLITYELIQKETYGKVQLTDLGRRTAVRLSGQIEQLQSILSNRLCIDAEAGLQAALYFLSTMDAETLQKMLSYADVK